MMEPRRAIGIVIIDSDQMLSTAMRCDLEKSFAQYRPRFSHYASLEQALPHVLQEPGLVVARCPTDDPNGAKTMSLIRSRSFSVEVILLTDNVHADTAASALEHGAHDCIVRNDYMFRRLSLSVGQCLRLLDLKWQLEQERSRTRQTVITIGLIFSVLIALRIWAPQLFGQPAF